MFLLRRKTKAYVLDTSALFAYIEDEAGAEMVEKLLVEAEKGNAEIHLCFVSLTEVFYITLQEKNELEAKRRIDLIRSLAATIHEQKRLTCLQED
jgi:predicted nucleic acid-binding protein